MVRRCRPDTWTVGSRGKRAFCCRCPERKGPCQHRCACGTGRCSALLGLLAWPWIPASCPTRDGPPVWPLPSGEPWESPLWGSEFQGTPGKRLERHVCLLGLLEQEWNRIMSRTAQVRARPLFPPQLRRQGALTLSLLGWGAVVAGTSCSPVNPEPAPPRPPARRRMSPDSVHLGTVMRDSLVSGGGGLSGAAGNRSSENPLPSRVSRQYPVGGSAHHGLSGAGRKESAAARTLEDA